MKVFVGLGNPGREYDKTRHNMGFMGIDRLAERLKTDINKEKFQSLLGETVHNGEKVILVKPFTYMNLSGQAIRAIIDWYKPSISDLIILFDDMDISLGQIRLRMKGSAGGHNGIKSLIQHLGTQDFQRIKMGIGRPAPGTDVIGHVLSAFRKEEQPYVKDAVEYAASACMFIIENDFQLAMNRFNDVKSKPPTTCKKQEG